MFHIHNLEVVHWDFWQRFTLPLDAQIITIVGPNGSGKTTLLDALRTLFALRCSGKRDFRRYVRRNEKGFAWLRATVSNRPSGTGKRPFFPCLSDEVTLACRIRRASGDWTRDYAIADGDQSIEAIEQAGDWVGLRDYQHRLAWGGLTPAIAKVLSLEQGETDKLCEYSPRALLDLVFDVFGDKEVLHNFEAAREEQKNAEAERNALETDLEKLRAQVEARKQEASRYLEWKRLNDEIRLLERDVLPRLEGIEMLQTISQQEQDIHEIEQEQAGRIERFNFLQERQNASRTDAERHTQSLREAREQETAAHARHLAAHDRLRDLEKTLEERTRLRLRVEQEEGHDALKLEGELEKAEQHARELRAQRQELTRQREEKSEQLRQVKARSGAPSDPDVGRFRRLLQEAGIGHRALSEIIEVQDASWQVAVEAILRPYRHVLLLDEADDRQAAWKLGERERFRHFIVPETERPAPAPRGSLAEILRFAGPIPRWLGDLLGRIQRVDSVEAARDLPSHVEWITPEAFHRERRGARHLGRPADFHFGELGRQTRQKALESDLRGIDDQLARLQEPLQRVQETVSASRNRLMGLQSASLLAARSSDFANAEAELPAARSAFQSAESELAEIRQRMETVREQLQGCQIGISTRERELHSLKTHFEELQAQLQPRKTQCNTLRQALETRAQQMPDDWLSPESVGPIQAQYESAHAVRGDLRRLRERLAQDDWNTDAAVLTLRDRMQAELQEREAGVAQRKAYGEAVARITDEARAAYIAKLRATVRQYGKNLKSLGGLAGVDVDCPIPHLDNSDAALHQAGLEVRFNFDQKGAVGLNDGEASGGQQVMKSLILLIGLLMDEARPGGFVFVDEPFAHLDVANIDRVGRFLRATQAQYLITTPVTHNANVFEPSQLTLVTRKRQPNTTWAQPIGVLVRELQ